ncbi:MAG: alpha/beta fold hydrolase [Terriglobales bacterium]
MTKLRVCRYPAHMRVIVVVLLVLASFASAQTPNYITDPQQIVSRQKLDLQAFTAEKLFMTRAIGEAAWSADGKQIAFISNISGRNNLWLVPADGGWPTQFTVSDQRQTSPLWSPSGKYIAYTSDKDGNEQWDVYVVSTSSGDVINLSNTPAIAEEDPAWAPTSRWLAWAAKPKTGSSHEIETFDLLLRRRRTLTQNTPPDLSNFHPLWSPDGNWIAYTQERADGHDANVFVVEVASGKSTKLTPHESDARYFAAAWSPDGKKLLIGSNAQNGFTNIALLDVATKNIEWLTRDKWESQPGSFSPDGQRITWTTNVDGNVEVFLYDTATKQASTVDLPKGVNGLAGRESAFSPDGTRLLLFHEGPNAPRDVWVYDIASRKAQQITHSLVAGVRGADMVEPYLVRYPSSDGKFQISAWVYAPYNQIKNGQVPAIVLVHGGPASQTMNGFHRLVQFVVNQGYFVIAPNYRGSTGYGKEFEQANRMDMGGGDLADVLAAADWITKTGYVDAQKLVVMGGSYGGYMTMMAVTTAPERWAAGVALVPFVNWFTEVQNEDPALRQYDLATMGDPVKNKPLWEERSPINFVDRIRAPLLLMAGGNDPRCPKTEAQQVADAVRKNGGKVELKIYENEGHGFARVENQIDAYKKTADFLKFHVPAPGCGQAACEVQ